ncbi:MAG: ComEC/Rec2 family competence protein [Clostridia bacterium]|nr:ComEC/Rec2 family competence protein [Clostridia bacterium]
MKNPRRTAVYILICGIVSFCMRAFGIGILLTVLISIALCALVFVFALFYNGKKKIIAAFAAAFFAAAFCALGVLRAGSVVLAKNISAYLNDENEHTVVCKVSETGYVSSYGARYYATVISVDGEKTHGLKIAVDAPFDTELFEGDEINVVGTISPIEKYTSYYDAEGIYAVIDGKSVTMTSSGSESFLTKIRGFALTLSDKLSSVIGGDEGRAASAMTLGDKSRLTDEMKLDFRRAGASHVLAVSGLHLSVIVIALRYLLHGIGKKKRNVVLMIAAALYAALTGFSPSVCRAALMCILYLLSEIIGEEADGITSLFISLAIILAVSPHSVFSAGLWLSFSATLGILVVMPSVKFIKLLPKEDDNIAKAALKRAARYLIELVIISAAAQIFTAPVMLFTFGGMSVVSILSGIIVVPLASAALVLSIIACVFMYIPILSSVFAFIAKLPLYLIIRICRALSDINGAYISIDRPFAPYIIAVCAVAIVAIIFIKRADKRLILGVGTLGVAAFAICLAIVNAVNSGTTDIVYSVKGKNENIVIGSGGNSFLIDISSGGYSSFEMATDEVNKIYHRDIDYVILTHLHINHISSLCKLTTNIKVRNIVLPTAEIDTDAEVLRSLSLFLPDDVNLIYYNRASLSEVCVGDVTITLPGYVMLKRSTHPVIAFTVEERGHVVGYVGSSSLYSDEKVNEIYLNSEVLISGVHGPVQKEPVPAKYIPAQYIIIGSSDDSLIDTAGYDGNVIYSSDYEGRVHISFKNK